MSCSGNSKQVNCLKNHYDPNRFMLAMVRERKGSSEPCHRVLSGAKWVFRAPFCALAVSPRVPQKLRGKLELPLGGREAAYPLPIPAKEWGPLGLGPPHRLQVPFLPRNIFRHETHFSMDQHDLWVTGRGVVFTSVLRLSILMCPSLWVGLDQLHLWGHSLASFALFSPFQGHAVCET